MSAILNGDRIRLTVLRPEDADAIAGWQERGDYLRDFDAIPAVPKTASQLVTWIEGALGSANGFLFAIRALDDDRLVGILEFDGILWPHGTAWFSIAVFDPADRGKGYGSDALRTGLRFAFHELNLHRVQLTVFSYNTRAIGMYERLGFVHEGTYREFLERDGQRHDMLLYGLLRREWETRQER